MHTLVIANQKGGATKSTLAAHLGVALERAKKGRVAFIDLDPQASLSAWWNEREEATPAFAACERMANLPRKLQELAAMGFDWVVIDTPPSVGPVLESAAAVADLIVVPIQAGSFDLKAAPKTVELFERAGKPFVFVLSRVKGGKTLGSMQAAVALSGLGPVCPAVIADRVIYGTATHDGRTIFDMTGQAKGIAEQMDVLAFVLSRFPEYRTKRKEKAHV